MSQDGGSGRQNQDRNNSGSGLLLGSGMGSALVSLVVSLMRLLMGGWGRFWLRCAHGKAQGADAANEGGCHGCAFSGGLQVRA